MSVALVVTYEDCDDDNRYVPIASQESFVRDWLPAARSLSLQWVPKFAGGTAIPNADVPQVLEELQKMGAWLSAPGHTLPQDQAAQMRARLDDVASLLREVEHETDNRIFIG